MISMMICLYCNCEGSTCGPEKVIRTVNLRNLRLTLILSRLTAGIYLIIALIGCFDGGVPSISNLPVALCNLVRLLLVKDFLEHVDHIPVGSEEDLPCGIFDGEILIVLHDALLNDSVALILVLWIFERPHHKPVVGLLWDPP